MKNVLVLIEMLDELCDSAFVDEFVFLFCFGTLIRDRDLDTLIEKGFLAQPLREFFEAEFGRREDLRIGFESDFRSVFF